MMSIQSVSTSLSIWMYVSIPCTHHSLIYSESCGVEKFYKLNSNYIPLFNTKTIGALNFISLIAKGNKGSYQNNQLKIWNSTVPPFPLAVPSSQKSTAIIPLSKQLRFWDWCVTKTSKVIMLWIIARNGIRTHLVHPCWSWSFWTKNTVVQGSKLGRSTKWCLDI